MEDQLDLPERMFAVGHEPVGVRVTSYGPSDAINSIMNALEEKERRVIRESAFGKFISIPQKPSYSGRFVRFVMSRLLNVNKKHEIWILFAGKPIRFSLREFAIVTGLPCGKYPKKPKKSVKNNITQTPYWPSLFGKLELVSITKVIKMLKKKTVKEEEKRIKVACLALLSRVLLTTTHQAKIVKEHVEAIEDLNAFFEFPWGRVAFEMLINCIRERNEVTLSQNTLAIKGFVHAIQLVMVEAVPALLEVVQVNSTSSSESDDDDGKDGTRQQKLSLSPAHARDLHEDPNTQVDCIIADDGEIELDEKEFEWSDDEVDKKVDNMVELINEDFQFTDAMFVGGATKSDVLRMIKEAKEKSKNTKLKKVGSSSGVEGQCNDNGVGFPRELDAEAVADIISEKFRVEFNRLEEKVDTCLSNVEELRTGLSGLEVDITAEVCREMKKLKGEVVDGIIAFLDKSVSVVGNNNCGGEKTNDNEEMCKEVESDLCGGNDNQRKTSGVGVRYTGNDANFSQVGDNHDTQNRRQRNEVEEDLVGPATNVDGVYIPRKSKRARILPASLVGDYQCDKQMLLRIRHAHLLGIGETINEDYATKFSKLKEKLKAIQNLAIGSLTVSTKDFGDIAGRTKASPPKIIDMLVHQIRDMFGKEASTLLKKMDFFDTKFVSNLMKNFPKFLKMQKKESHQFPKAVLQCFTDDKANNVDGERFYFPFNFDKNHWVGICVDCVSSTVVILDSNTSLRNDSVIAKEVNPVAALFPYLLKQIGHAQFEKEVKPYAVERPRSIPQNAIHADSGLTAVLLMQAHATGGLEVCRCIGQDILATEAERLMVKIYENNYNTL